MIRIHMNESLTPQEYNNNQTEVGSPLKTYRGSVVKRSKYGVGKEIGGDIYFHKEYVKDVVPEDVWSIALSTLRTNYPDFEYNCIKYTPKTGTLSFQESPDFDTAREPIVGNYITVKSDGSCREGHSNYIWHHKWCWVRNNYTGFNVPNSWNWSRIWLNTLQETSDGNGMAR